MVPRSGSVKIFELQSALAQKCAAVVELEAAQEAKAAAIRSFKMAVAAVCPPLPPTQLSGSRKTAANASGSVGSRRIECAAACQSGKSATGPTDEIKVKAATQHTLQVYPKALPSCPLDPTARPFIPCQPRRNCARVRRNRRQRNDRRHNMRSSDACFTGNSKQRRAESRKPKQEAWQAANKAEPSQHGGVLKILVPQHATPPLTADSITATAPIADVVAEVDDRSVADDCALAAARDRREARCEAQALSDTWCGPPAKSIFDQPTPPMRFINAWYSRYTPRVGESAFGNKRWSLLKSLDRKPHWTVLGHVIRGAFGAKPATDDDDDDFVCMPWNLPMCKLAS